MVAAAAVHRARAAYVADLAAVFGEIVAAARLSRHERRAALQAERHGRPGADPPRTSCARACRSSARSATCSSFVVDGRPAAEVLSGGEQKMIVLFLKFAKLELFRRRHDDAPLFLLDDVDAELDLEILQQSAVELPVSTQVFATSAKEAFLAALQAGPHRRLTLENGRVTAARDFA